MALLMAGCTSNQIIELTGGESDGQTEGTEGTDTSPPAESGTDDGPRPECVEDWECGDCGWCTPDGVCQDDLGCCAADPEDPWVWHCSPPWDCYEDSDCFEGEVCNDGYCEPDPSPEIVQPPACRGDLALSVEQVALDRPLVQIATVEGGAWGIDQSLQIAPVSFAGGIGAAVGTLEGEQARELLGIDASTLVALGMGTSIEGEPHYLLTRVHDAGGGAWELLPGAPQPATAAVATWLGDPAEVVVGAGTWLDRYDTGLQSAGPDSVLEADAVALTAMLPGGHPRSVAAVALASGQVQLWDVTTGSPLGEGHALRGQPVDLASARDPVEGAGQRLLAVSHLPPAPESREVDMAAIEVIGIDAGTLQPAAPFGAPGVPNAIVAVDLDGNGIDDVLVANADGRLDLYLMEQDGPLCRAFLPLSPILDLEVGDANGDGHPDVLVSDASPGLLAIAGATGG